MKTSKLPVIIALAAVALIAAIAYFSLSTGDGPHTAESEERTAESEPGASGDDLWAGFGKSSEPPPGLLPEGTKAGDAPPASPIDLAHVRAQLPDNIYWKMLAPTRDPELKKFREQEKARWNDEYGKVLSNTASPREIRRYYDYKKRLSEDYIRLLSFLLEEYGDELTEHQEGLFKLGIELHAARIQQVPDDVRRALERRQAYEAKKADWQARK